MGQVTISISDETDSRLRNYMELHGYSSLSSLVGEAIREKLSQAKPLDDWSRVALVVQLENQRLLDAISSGREPFEDGEWSRDYELEALRNGYESDYSNAFKYVYEDELTKSDRRYVFEVLDMYGDLQFSVGELKDEKIAKRVIFPGFDGNDETIFMTYAQFLRSNRRFAHIKCFNEDVNSHGMNPDYRVMLARYKKIRSVENVRVKPLSKAALYELYEIKHK